MKLGGVVLASLAIIIVVLVGNGRWSAVWAAALGNGASTGASTTTSNGLPVTNYGGPGGAGVF